MAQQTIRASVVGIRTDSPRGDDRFLVDTNAWFWFFYPRASLRPDPPGPYQMTDYPDYLKKVSGAQAARYWCGLNLAELSRVIEQSEWQIYAQQLAIKLRPKTFRYTYPNQRLKIVRYIKETWEDVRDSGTELPVLVDGALIDEVSITLSNSPLDGMDGLLVEAMKRQGITQIITDDGDYASMQGITVFTANTRVIDLAAQQGRLLQRLPPGDATA